jgi:hypothetical protein
VLLKNLLAHFRPDYLFSTGDANLRHSTQFSGQLGWLDVLGLVALAMLFAMRRGLTASREGAFIGYCAFGFVCSVLPAALTWESIPHALRSIGAWPFLSCLVGLGLAELVRKHRIAFTCIVAVAASFAIGFGRDYFVDYPRRAAGPFQADVKRWAIAAKDSGDWTQFERQSRYLELGRRYFRMAYGNVPCTSAGPRETKG